MPHITRITIFPIKSLTGCDVVECAALPSGALQNDRRWAIVDADGQWINGKRASDVHRLRASYDLAAQRIQLGAGNRLQARSFDLRSETDEISAWLGAYFGQVVRLSENATHGFPDDTESPGPTWVSTATLEAVTEWFPGLNLESIRARFRANIEIGGVEAFWEDRLFAGPDETVRFRAGELEFLGTNPCQRCVVPTRSPRDGSVLPHFARTFAERRAATLPPWADHRRFDHFYRLTVNSRPAHSGGVLRVGDDVEILHSATNSE